MFKRGISLAVISSVVVFLSSAGALAGKVNRADRNRTISITYGVVTGVEQVRVKSAAGGNAAMGGMIGLAASHGKSSKKKAENALAGALAAALLTKALEKKHTADAYTVRLTDGATVKIIQEKADLRVGDCVALEEGTTSNIRRVASEMCKVTEHHEDPQVQEYHSDNADACSRAKQLVLEAETDEQFARASEKVKILCH